VRRAALLSLALVCALLVAPFAWASRVVIHLPTPGSASQITALVAASSSIERLPSDLLPPARAVGADGASYFYPAAKYSCTAVTQCVFGDQASTRTMVLFGDSHAHMWIPAIAPVALAAKMRLVVLWRPGCPADDVSVWNLTAGSVNEACNAFRAKAIREIQQLHAAVVIIASRTSNVPVAGAPGMADATWQAAAAATILALQSRETKVGIIQDITSFSAYLPHCLWHHSKAIQTCSTPNPNPRERQRDADEEAAAASTGATYVLTQPWLCSSVCSPVIGKMVAYLNNEHVSATYSEYLSKVFATELRPLLSRT
jgi:hypothetical protein